MGLGLGLGLGVGLGFGRGDLAGDALEDEGADEGQRLHEEGAHALTAQEGAREARPGLGVGLAVGEHVQVVGERLQATRRTDAHGRTWVRARSRAVGVRRWAYGCRRRVRRGVG